MGIFFQEFETLKGYQNHLKKNIYENFKDFLKWS